MEQQMNKINKLLHFKDMVAAEYGNDAVEILHEVDKIIVSMKSVHNEHGYLDKLVMSYKNLDEAYKRLFLAMEGQNESKH